MSAPPTSVKKLRLRPKARLAKLIFSPLGKVLIGLVLLVSVAGFSTFTYFYVKYAKLIDEKLRIGPFTNTAKIYAAPRAITVGDKFTQTELINQLRRAGYGESASNRTGWYHVRPDAIEVMPGRDAVQPEGAVVKFQGEKLLEIVSLEDHTARKEYLLEPELITNLSDRNREKRRLVRYEDIPKMLVNAIISAEDKRFFSHAGFDPLRIVKAVYVDVKEGYKKEGASTLSMQLARGFWLDPDKNWKRKAAEAMITLQLEQRLTKEEIFEYYANNADLGRRGSFAIRGIGQASQAYFGKDVRQLSTSESAVIAGLIRLPSFYNPIRHPERMTERRNLVLGMMRQNGYLTDREYAKAIDEPLNLVPGAIESADAPYFVDVVHDELQASFADRDFQAQSYRIYTTLDMNLQRAASEAVRAGMANVDALLKKQKRNKGVDLPDPQCALIALDPHTGEIKALIGGRNYGASQLNHVRSKRQPGSVFKPWVYATAMNTAIEQNASQVITPLTKVVDEPTTFWFDDKPYEPGNFDKEYRGEMTVRQAMAKSINVPAVKVAEMVGYAKVVALARKAGMNLEIKATPSVALGAYEVTPLEIAGAYTVFANGGEWVKPNFMSLIRDQENNVVWKFRTEKRAVLDQRIAYMMVSLLEEVTRSGTAAGIRSRGITVPAAGKTGTSHDGWFAGFTSELLCIVWVGFDDNRELNLEGSKSALPIWAEFMKRALEFKEYRNARPFQAPDGIVAIQIDPETGQPATAACPQTRTEVFVAGTQPLDSCRLHGGGQPGVTHVTGWDQPAAPPPVPASIPGSPPPALSQPGGIRANGSERAANTDPDAGEPAARKEPEKSEKKGFFRRLLGVFK